MATLSATLAIETFRAEGDGCLGYLVVDETSRTAAAIDPRLDLVDRFHEALAARDARLTHVLDTHTHADHLSGVRRLAQRTGATVLAHVASKLKGPSQRIKDGATFTLGGASVQILDAPGHTPDSVALLVDQHLFTGDALFAGGAGRTDFMGGSASDLFETFRRFAALPDTTVVHPGHDYVGPAATTVGGHHRQAGRKGETRLSGTATGPPLSRGPRARPSRPGTWRRFSGTTSVRPTPPRSRPPTYKLCGSSSTTPCCST